MKATQKDAGRYEKAGKPRERLYLDATPEVEKGINLVRKPGRMPALQALTAKSLAGKQSKAVWADVKNEASTYALAGQKPSLLEKVEIGRAFTPFQHHKLVHELEDFIDSDTEVLVVPHFPLLYLSGSTNEWESEELFEESWNEVKRLQKKYGLKVIVTVPNSESQLCLKVEADAGKVIEVEKTSSGWKYSSEDFDTRAYRKNSKIFQTTIRFWERVERNGMRKVRS